MVKRIGLIAATLVVLLALLAAGALWRARPLHNGPQTAANYRDPENWVCRPGGKDACAADLAITAIAADGTETQIASPPADPEAPIDCFYVYPTVSRDLHENAPLAPTVEVSATATAQFARFRTVCRTFAPIYRQVTLRALMANTVHGHWGDPELAYADVRDAFNDYLAHDNAGRGFVLIGHSQGSRVLKRLLREEIEGKPAQKQLVLAILGGNSVVVPKPGGTGGDFVSLQPCTAKGQSGCFLAWSSFRAGSPPPQGKSGAPGHYGIDPDATHELACTNPAALGGGAAPMDAIFYRQYGLLAHVAWTTPPTAIATPFVATPGLVSGQCVHDGTHSYLAITFNQGNGARTDDIPGDVRFAGRVLPGWGLHLLDMDLPAGNLITDTAAAAQTWKSHQPAASQ
jgi:hypothetical protein